LLEKIKIKNLSYEAIINFFILLYAFCLPISRAGISFATILLMLFWILQANFSKKFDEIKNSYFILTIFTFVAYSSLAVIWSDDKFFALEYVRKYYHFLLIPIIYTSLKKKNIDRVFLAFLFGMFVSVIFFYGVLLNIFTYEGTNSNSTSVFMNRIDYSIYIVLAIFIAINQLIYSKCLNWKFFYGFASLVFTITLFLNGGRTGYFAFFVVLIILVLMNSRYKLIGLFNSIIAIVVIFLVAYNLSPVFKDRMIYLEKDIERMIIDGKFDQSFSMRIKMWELGIKSSFKEPLLGNGIGDEIVHIKDEVEKYNLGRFVEKNTNFINYHNIFIHHWSQLGLVGLLLTILLFYYLYKLEFKKQIYKNLNTVFVTICTLLFLQGILAIPSSKIFFGFFASVFLTISKIELNK